jgi:hypothetical protein
LFSESLGDLAAIAVVCDVASGPTGHEDFHTSLVILFQDQDFFALLGSGSSGPQTGSPTPNDDGIPLDVTQSAQEFVGFHR